MRSTLVTVPVLVGALAVFVACDKGPQKGEAPAATKGAAKTTPAKTPATPDTATPVKPAAATPVKADKLDGKVYGKGVTMAASTPISKIHATPGDYDGKKVRVEGMIIDVCAKRGCWLEMAGDKPGQRMKFKVDDGVMVFPMTSRGKYAVAEGVVSVKKLSLEQTRKHAVYVASEKGKKLDPKTITEPRTVIMLAGAGAVVRDKK